MNSKETTYRFGDWLVEPAYNRISRDGDSHQLEAKTIDLLTYLLEHAEDVVSVDELLVSVWPGRVVEQSTAYRRINQLRHVLSDDARAPRYIRTIHKRGYKLVAPVSRIDSNQRLLQEETVARPTIAAPDRGRELGGTESAAAWQHYQIGQELHNVDPERALRELTMAVEIDPEFARAWTTMALAHGSRSRDPMRTEEALADVARAAARAVAAAPDFWEAHAALGRYLMARRDFIGADRTFQSVVDLACQADAIPHPAYTQYLRQIGRDEECLDLVRSLQHVDPLYPVALVLYSVGRRDEAVAELHRMRGTRTYIGGSNWWQRLELSLAIERGGREELDDLVFRGTQLEGLWGTDAFLDTLRGELASDAPPPRLMLAQYALYAARHGDADLAVEFLRVEYLRDAYAGYFMIWHPLLSAVRRTEGFKTFLTDLGLPAMFRATGRWNDYCKPVGPDDFICQ